MAPVARRSSRASASKATSVLLGQGTRSIADRPTPPTGHGSAAETSDENQRSYRSTSRTTEAPEPTLDERLFGRAALSPLVRLGSLCPTPSVFAAALGRNLGFR